jgi:hypothetical protein
MQKSTEHCGCAGPGKPEGEIRPLYQLKYLIEVLERQEKERNDADAKASS